MPFFHPSVAVSPYFHVFAIMAFDAVLDINQAFDAAVPAYYA